MSKPSSRRKLIVTVVAVLVVIAAGVFLLTRPKKAKYKTSVVARSDISISVSATGTVNPVNQVTVGSQVSGTLDNVLVDFNDHVTSGQVLARIDPRNYESALEQAKANRASAQASLTQAELTSARAETLYSSGLIAFSDYLQAKTDFELAKAKRDQVQASYEQAQTNLAYTTITAPMSGIVVARKVEPGQTVAASLQSPDLFTIADLSEMQVEVSIDEADVGKLDTGLAATFDVDAYPESAFSGKLVQVRNQPVVSSNVTTYIGIVRVANPGMLLKPGMTANVKIIVRAVDDVLLVPNAALSTKLASTLGFSSAARSQTSGRPGAATRGTGRPGMQGPPGGLNPGDGRGQHRGFRPGATAAGDSSRAGAPPDTVAGAAAVSPTVTQTVFILSNGKPVPREVETGMADGSNTEVVRGLEEGELVITGLGQGKSSNGTTTQQNRVPMMGGFGGPPPGGR
ncbi:MAG: efflux RND transporter periplasmic adaptor subunit [candidate division WOR-3 bacterium]|nr:efflux RND transporter periplasmic adaptor subunit [candidate division WOR-3 bacterium]